VRKEKGNCLAFEPTAHSEIFQESVKCFEKVREVRVVAPGAIMKETEGEVNRPRARKRHCCGRAFGSMKQRFSGR